MKQSYSRNNEDRARTQGVVMPYGGVLTQNYAAGTAGQALLNHIGVLPRVDISEREFLDLELLGSGGFSPLEGFMDRETYHCVRDHARLPSGLPWGWPVTLSASDEQLESIQSGTELGLYFRDLPVAVMVVSDIYHWDARKEAIAVFDTENTDAPAVAERLREQKTHLLGGSIALIVDSAESSWSEEHLWPNVIRDFCEQQNWRRLSAVYGMHPWHRGHEYVLRNILDTSDAVLVQSPAPAHAAGCGLSDAIATEAGQALLRNYFPRTRVLSNRLSRHICCEQNRAVLQQAIISQNYGCDRIYFVPPSDSKWNVVHEQEIRAIFDQARDAGLSVQPEFLETTFFCQDCDTVVTGKTCPHEKSHHMPLEEAELVERVYRGEALPPQAVRPEIARVLSRTVSHQADPARLKRGGHLFPHAPEISRSTRETVAGHRSGVLWMTGLSGSGKSTIAHRLERELLLSGHRVFVLDGDTLRTGLCADLGFSREARQENLRRAGEVVKVMREAGMLVIASFISPFRSERETLLDIIGDGFYEVFVDASLDTCETRDPKGLYKRARAGVIPEFTGVSSPYEPPESPAIHIQTDTNSIEECVRKLVGAMTELGLLRTASGGVPLSAQLPLPINRNHRMQ